MAEELNAEITTLQDEIKATMGGAEGPITLTVGAYKITWKPIKSTRLDSKALKVTLPEIVDRIH